MPHHHISPARGVCACRSWHNTVPALFSSIPPPYSHHLVLLPSSCLPFSPISLLKDTPCQVLINNPPVSSLPERVPSLSCSHPSCPSPSASGSPGTVPHQPCSPQGCHHLLPCLSSCSIPRHTLHRHHLLSTLVPATCPLLASASQAVPLLCPPPSPSPELGLPRGAERRDERRLLPAGLPAPQCPGQGTAFQRKLRLGSGGGHYLVTITCFFLCGPDVASSHRLRSPNVRFLPTEAFRDAPFSPSALRGPAARLGLAGGLGTQTPFVNWVP